MAKIILENKDAGENRKGGVFLDGSPNDLLALIVICLHANEFIATLFKDAIFLYDQDKKKGANPTFNHDISLDSDALKKYEDLFKKK